MELLSVTTRITAENKEILKNEKSSTWLLNAMLDEFKTNEKFRDRMRSKSNAMKAEQRKESKIGKTIIVNGKSYTKEELEALLPT